MGEPGGETSDQWGKALQLHGPITGQMAGAGRAGSRHHLPSVGAAAPPARG
jgi:hypothetical protein